MWASHARGVPASTSRLTKSTSSPTCSGRNPPTRQYASARAVHEQVVRVAVHARLRADIHRDRGVGQIVEQQDRPGGRVESVCQHRARQRGVDDQAGTGPDLRRGTQGVYQVLEPTQQRIRVLLLRAYVDRAQALDLDAENFESREEIVETVIALCDCSEKITRQVAVSST